MAERDREADVDSNLESEISFRKKSYYQKTKNLFKSTK